MSYFILPSYGLPSGPSELGLAGLSADGRRDGPPVEPHGLESAPATERFLAELEEKRGVKPLKAS